MPWLPKAFIGAVRNDFQKFICTFRQMDCDKFKSFERVWFNLHFDLYHCYSGRRGRSRKCIEFIMNQMNTLLVSYFHRDESRLDCVCALYILYGLFYTQPLKIPVRIRLELEDYNLIFEFCSHNKDANPEIFFCYWKLLYDGAIDFVMSPFPYTPSYIVVKTKKEKKKDVEDFPKLIKRLGISFDVDKFMSELEEYRPLRSKLEPYLPEVESTVKIKGKELDSKAAMQIASVSRPEDLEFTSAVSQPDVVDPFQRT